MASTPATPSRPLAAVRLEVRTGGPRPTVYEVGEGGFLIGGVPGCDLRLSGANVPPVLCLIARLPGGASLRKLAPVAPITVNGRPASATYLSDGDKIGAGAVEIIVRLSAVVEAGPIALVEVLEEQVRRQAQRIEALTAQLAQPAPPPEASPAAPPPDDGEAERARREVARLRRELMDRYQQRRDRLLRQQQAIHKAGRNLQERKRAFDGREGQVVEREQHLAAREAEVESRLEQLGRERALLDEQHALLASRQQEWQRDLGERLAEVQAREKAVLAEKTALEKGQKLHQADLVRLDRIQAGIEAKQKQMAERALEIDRRFEQLQRDSRDLEEQAAHLDGCHARLAEENDRLEARKKELDTQVSQLNERSATLEGQQAMLATLRTRLERMREDLRQQEQALSDGRALHEAGEADLRARLEEAERFRTEARNDKELIDEERRRFDERRTLLEQAVAQLRQAREALAADQEALHKRQEELDAASAEQALQAGDLVSRGEQVQGLHAQLQAERAALREREQALARSEQALATLQNQVRRRSEELDLRQQQIEAAEAAQAERTGQLTTQLHEQAEALRQAQEALESRRRDAEALEAALAERAGAVAGRERAADLEGQRQEEERSALTSGLQALAAERSTWEAERQQREAHRQRLDEEIQALTAAVPDLELRTTAAMERLGQAREQLRGHLAEVYSFARQAREAIDAALGQARAEAEQVREEDHRLRAARDEHRLAVAAFRQQLIEWQGRVADLRQSLRVGSTRLEQEKAQVERQARQVATTTERLAEESRALEQQRRDVAERRGEVGRHLNDMREWYRRKWRELAGVDAPPDAEPGESDVVLLPASEARAATGPPPTGRAVLTLADEVAPADRQLGDQLAALGLVDADTLQALWAESRRQRRPLRNLLLDENYLTLFQMALIEAGNLDGLVLGPVRVIDKLAASPREAVYRVFDPRRNAEAILRHLAEPEMDDAVRPDEFAQRFAAAAGVAHANVAAVYEVLTIAGRPAALLEHVVGLASGDWPGLAAAPGVWYRLTCQSAVALQAVHAAGLCHGHLDAGSFVLTPQGALKLAGVGESRWLAGLEDAEESVAADLAALGEVIEGWSQLATGGKAKPLPEALRAVVQRLRGQSGEPFASAQALLEALEAVSAQVPPSSAAWDRLLRHLREQALLTGLRHSA